MRNFSAFVKRKDRTNKDHLRLLGKILKKSGFSVKDFLDHHEDPYLYIEKPVDHDKIIESLEFGGIRVFSKGTDIIAYRPQNNLSCQPFGAAYLLDVKGMFKDLMKEGQNDETGKDLIKYIVEEVLNFFLRAAKAQREEDKDIDGDSLGKVVNNSSTGGTDYSNTVQNNSRNN